MNSPTEVLVEVMLVLSNARFIRIPERDYISKIARSLREIYYRTGARFTGEIAIIAAASVVVSVALLP